MLNAIMEQLGMFFTTFGILIALFIIVCRFLAEEILLYGTSVDEEVPYFRVFLRLFNTFVGKPTFIRYVFPFGSSFNTLFLVIFKMMLLPLLTAMIINRYRGMFN